MFKYKKNGPFFSNFVSLISNIGFSQNFCQKNIAQAEKYLEIIYFFCLSRTKTTSWLTNLRNFQKTKTFYACFHRSTAFTFGPGFVAYSTIHIICRCVIATNQITHIIPAIVEFSLTGTFDFCRFKRVWLQAKVLEVTHSFGF